MGKKKVGHKIFAESQGFLEYWRSDTRAYIFGPYDWYRNITHLRGDDGYGHKYQIFKSRTVIARLLWKLRNHKKVIIETKLGKIVYG